MPVQRFFSLLKLFLLWWDFIALHFYNAWYIFLDQNGAECVTRKNKPFFSWHIQPHPDTKNIPKLFLINNRKSYLSVSSGKNGCPVDLWPTTCRKVAHTLSNFLVKFSLRLDDQPCYQPFISILDDCGIDTITINHMSSFVVKKRTPET